MLMIGLDCGSRYRDLVSASDQTAAHSQLESGSLGGGVLKGGADQRRRVAAKLCKVRSGRVAPPTAQPSSCIEAETRTRR